MVPDDGGQDKDNRGTHIPLTHSCPEIHFTSVIWMFHTFKDNFRIKYKSEKYLKRSCR